VIREEGGLLSNYSPIPRRDVDRRKGKKKTTATAIPYIRKTFRRESNERRVFRRYRKRKKRKVPCVRESES